MKSQDITRLYNKLKSERTNVEGMWQYMEDYVLPYRLSSYQSETEGEVDWKKRKIYDHTAVEACDALAASLQGNLITPSSRWFDLRFQLDELNDDSEAKQWLEDVSNVIFMNLQTSNFNLESAESLLDLCGYGTMALMEELDDDNEIVFTAAPISDVYFEVGSHSNVKRFYRKLEWTALQIIDKFGEENIPKELDKILDPDKPDQKHEIVFCIYEIPENKKNDTSKTLAVDARPFGYQYVFVNGSIELKRGGYYEQPAFITRWRTTAGSIWGNSPGMKCLASILDVNELAALTLEEAALNVEPPLMTTQRGIMSDLDRSRAGLTIVSNMNDVAELPGRGDTRLSILDISELRQMIRRAFYEDQLQLKDSPAMTATEVNVRYELMQRLLGPTMGRMKDEFLDPLLMRTFGILFRLGKLPQPPQVVIDAQAEFDVEYLGPLPRAQKMEVARNIAGYIGQLGSLAETFPNVLDVINIDDAVRGLGEYSGVPAKYMRNEKEVDLLRKERAKAQQRQQMASQLKEAGDAMQSLGQGAQSLPSGSIEDIQKAIGAM